MTGATLCSGIGAPEVAAPWIDWKWCAEIEPFPAAVLAYRHPAIANLDDVTAADFIDRAQAFGLLDVLVAGTPCQAFSVAGRRGSLGDARGNITLRLVEIVHAVKPRYLLWENVPGVLSTADNAFGCFLGGLVGSTEAIHKGELPASGQPAGWPRAGVVDGPLGAIAWRVLDAQHFGLAQRRERVFVVFRFGATGQHPAEILFEFDSLRRDFAPGKEAGEEPAGCLGGGAGERGWCNDLDRSGAFVSMSLNAKGGSGRMDGESETFVAHTLRSEGFDASEDGTGRGTPLVPVAFSAKDHGADAGPLAPTLRAMTHDRSHANAGGQVAVCFESRVARNGRGGPSELVPPLKAQSGGSGRGDGAPLVAGSGSVAVRRLTPRECERLQGLPDDYTLIPYRGKPAADGPRYRAIGNSMAVPVIRWILKRMDG
jgi:DNA (cytosine-5)-methyltransferase 1